MTVFKFGGASIKDVAGVRNLAEILKISGQTDLVVIVSAMGKTTNLLEKVVSAYLVRDTTACNEYFTEFQTFHIEIMNGLFENSSHPVYREILKLFTKMDSFMEVNKSKNHAFVYDQVVGYG